MVKPSTIFSKRSTCFSAATEALAGEIHIDAAILARGRSQGDAEIDIACSWPRQFTRHGKVTAEVFWDQTADEHDIVGIGAKCAPDGEQRGLGESDGARVVLAVGGEFHGRRNPGHSRKARA
jgi:hypothetical protein